MSYIKAVLPMKDYRLFMEMEGGSTAIVDLSGKLHDSGLFLSLLKDLRAHFGRQINSSSGDIVSHVYYSLFF